MPKSKVRGVWTALATPFKKNLAIDWDAYEKILEIQDNAGVTGVVVSGTTGEAPTLTIEEKIKLVAYTRENLNAKIKVMAGTGSSSTEDSVSLSIKAVAAGADSLLIVTPPYNKPSPEGLKLHFETIADAVNVPLCLYHVPGRTAQTLKPELLGELCKISRLKMVKEASADLGFFSRALTASNGASFFSGDDPTFLPSLAVGGVGVISVISNIYPEAMVRLCEAFFSGDLELAKKIHHILMPAIDAILCETNPGPLKAALEINGICGNYLRPPLAPVTDKNYTYIKTTLAATASKLSYIKKL